MKRTTSGFVSLTRRLGGVLLMLGLAGSIGVIAVLGGPSAGGGVGATRLNPCVGCEVEPSAGGRTGAAAVDSCVGCPAGPGPEGSAANPAACGCHLEDDDPTIPKTRGIGPHGPGGGPDEAANR